jgi:glycosyltransferase involved in cell wall biosynthesis
MRMKRKIPQGVTLPPPPELPEGVAPPKFSVVIPTYNCALSIAWTLDTLKAQNYANVEVIVVDAGSRDRTVEEVQRSGIKNLRVYTIAESNPFEMYNRGISLATGDYITMLYPGDAYLSDDVFNWIGATAHENDRPELVYCGCLRRDPGREPETLMRELSFEMLKRAHQPTSVEACFYRLDAIRALGKFDPQYRIRGGLDLFCRFLAQEDLRAVLFKRVLIDHDRPFQMPGTLMRRALENHRVLQTHFGWTHAFRWWVRQDHWRFIRWWLRSKRLRLWT